MKQAKAKPATTAPSAALAAKPEFNLRLVSLLDSRQVEGIEQIRAILAQRGFSCDHFEHKLIIKTETKRPINPKNPKGPTEKVTIEERININSSLKALRQMAWRAGKDPDNVLHVQIRRTKGESMSLPIIFERLLKQGLPIFVTGSTKWTQAQLSAQPDLNFEKIPPEISALPELQEELVRRTHRKKSMQTTARELLDMPGIKVHIAQKINDLALGRQVDLSEAEAVNINLLADLHNRYMMLLQGFQKDVEEKKVPPGVLCKLFAELVHSLRPSQVQSRLQDFILSEEMKELKSNEEIFAQVYATVQVIESGKMQGLDPNVINKTVLFNRIKSLVVLSRSQNDPKLWKQALFFHLPEEETTDLKENVHALVELTERVKKHLLHQELTSSKSLQDQFMIFNLIHYLQKHDIVFTGKIPDLERNIIASYAAPFLGIKLAQKPTPERTLALFSEKEPKVGLRFHSLQTVTAAYGSLMNSHLKQRFQDFLEPGRENLYTRFEKDFFPIMHYKLVKQPGWNLSWSKLGKWVEAQKQLSRLNERGLIKGDAEVDYNPLITEEILLGSGKSLYPRDFTFETFLKEFEAQKAKAQAFFASLIKDAAANPEQSNPSLIFTKLMEEGEYNFLSNRFRKACKASFLYEELSEVVVNSCSEVIKDIERSAINNKLVLHIPEKLAFLLYIGNEFVLSATKSRIKVHILSIPSENTDGFPAISRSFCANLTRYLKAANSPERKALIKCMQQLKEFHASCHEYYRSLSFVLIDQVVHHSHESDKRRTGKKPEHIKFFRPDKTKLLLGSLKNANLAKIYNFHGVNLTSGKPFEPDNYSLGQLLQGKVFFHSTHKAFQETVVIIQKIEAMLDRFADSLKQKEEFKRYSQMISQIKRMLGTPIEEITDNHLRMLQTFAIKLKSLADNSILPDGIIAQLHQEWKRKEPALDRKIHFYQQFITEGPSGSSSKDNMLLELKAAKEIIDTLHHKKVIIYFPGTGKLAQPEQLEQALSFAQKINPMIEFYLETTGLTEEQLESLSRFFDPRNFFNSSSLEPTPNPAIKGGG